MSYLSTFQQFLQIGKISEICDDKEKDQNNNPMYARVLPYNAGGVVSLPLVITPSLRGEFGDLKVEDPVWYFTAEDGNGMIFKRADGKWTEKIPGDLQLVVGKKENTCNVDSERGYLELHEGNFTMDKGNTLMKEGNFTMNKGSTLMHEGNFTMDKGDAEIKSGNATLDKGNLTLKEGAVTVENGSLVVHGPVTIEGDITLTGNMTTTGTITAAGNVKAASITSKSGINAKTISAEGAITAGGPITAAGTVTGSDVTAGAVTLLTHTHMVVSTGAPTATPAG